MAAIDGKAVLASLAVCALMSLFCLPLLVPKYGWDDANITLNYAQNIANGHGYVYYVNGERVEGSTSALWTAIATLGFMVSGEPENLLIVVSFLFAFGTVLFTLMTAKSLLRTAGLDPGMATLPTLALFAMLPSFFGVTVF